MSKTRSLLQRESEENVPERVVAQLAPRSSRSSHPASSGHPHRAELGESDRGTWAETARAFFTCLWEPCLNFLKNFEEVN